MDWIQSASRHNQSEALVTGKRFSKGDPLEFPAVSVIEVFVALPNERSHYQTARPIEVPKVRSAR